MVLFVAFQTAVAVGEELEDKLPHHEYYEYFGPDYTLHVPPSNMANQNSKKDLDSLRSALLTSLPSVLKCAMLAVDFSETSSLENYEFGFGHFLCSSRKFVLIW